LVTPVDVRKESNQMSERKKVTLSVLYERMTAGPLLTMVTC